MSPHALPPPSNSYPFWRHLGHIQDEPLSLYHTGTPPFPNIHPFTSILTSRVGYHAVRLSETADGNQTITPPHPTPSCAIISPVSLDCGPRGHGQTVSSVSTALVLVSPLLFTRLIAVLKTDTACLLAKSQRFLRSLIESMQLVLTLV